MRRWGHVAIFTQLVGGVLISRGLGLPVPLLHETLLGRVVHQVTPPLSSASTAKEYGHVHTAVPASIMLLLRLASLRVAEWRRKAQSGTKVVVIVVEESELTSSAIDVRAARVLPLAGTRWNEHGAGGAHAVHLSSRQPPIEQFKRVIGQLARSSNIVSGSTDALRSALLRELQLLFALLAL